MMCLLCRKKQHFLTASIMVVQSIYLKNIFNKLRENLEKFPYAFHLVNIEESKGDDISVLSERS